MHVLSGYSYLQASVESMKNNPICFANWVVREMTFVVRIMFGSIVDDRYLKRTLVWRAAGTLGKVRYPGP